MNRIEKKLRDLREHNKKALVTYLVAGDPDVVSTVPLMHAMVAGGADIIELGVAFSDPSAEGPTIQRAHERALENKVGLKTIFQLLKEFRVRDSSTPVVLMGYANPIEWMGYDAFASSAAAAGADGVLTVDIPPEEAHPLNDALSQEGLYNVFLLAPTTSEKRMQAIAEIASGFIYYVSLKGVTGSGALDVNEVADKLACIQSYTDLPICVGFGIKDADSAQQVGRLSAGVVVGSMLVEAVERSNALESAVSLVTEKVSELRLALDALNESNP